MRLEQVVGVMLYIFFHHHYSATRLTVATQQPFTFDNYV